MAWHDQILLWLTILATAADCVNLIVENGFKHGSHYYHLGDSGYAYHASSETEHAIYFKCVLYERGCRGRAVLTTRGPRFRHTQPHNHAADPHFVGKRHFQENVLDDVRNGLFRPFHEIVDQHRINNGYARPVRAEMNVNRLRGPMNRARGEAFPNIPRTLRGLTQELLRDPELAKTTDRSEAIYAGSTTATDGSHHVLFTSPRMAEFMGRCQYIHGDGTFKSRPAVPKSSQLFVVVTSWRHSVVPLAWALMESRTIAAYTAVMNLLKVVCPNLNPTVIQSDWEYPQQRAWQNAFPNADILGCLWHLCKAFVKKAKQLKLLRYRTALPNILVYIHMACAIALLPRRLFRVGLRVVKEEALRDDVLIAYLLQPFFQYLDDKWISNPNRRIWMSLYNAKNRTNNLSETHNRMLRLKVGAFRPNVFLFIEALAILENNASLDTDVLAPGGNPRRTRRWQSVWRDRQLINLSRDLEQRPFHNLDDTVLNFLRRASRLFQGAFNNHVADAVPQGRRRR